MRERHLGTMLLKNGSSEAAHCDPGWLHTTRTIAPTDQLTRSLNFLSARALTVLEAGLALKTHGSLVKGLMPLRAGVAAFFFNFRFNAPTNLKDPFFFSCSAATDM